MVHVPLILVPHDLTRVEAETTGVRLHRTELLHVDALGSHLLLKHLELLLSFPHLLLQGLQLS